MILVLTIVLALVPSAFLAWYFHSRDLRPEPARAVWATFGLGVVIIAPVLLVDWPIVVGLEKLGLRPEVGGTADAFLVAAIPEEFFKFVVLWFFASRRRWFDEPMDGIVYGVIASLGFATLENILYSLQGGLTVAILRAFTAVPGHAFCGAVMGWYVGQARFGAPERRAGLLARALLWPMVLHGLYDAPLLTLKRLAPQLGDDDAALVFGLIAATVLVLILEAVWAIRVTKRARREQAAAVAAMLAAGLPLEEPEPAPAAAAADRPAPNRLLAWLLLLLGGALATGGGLMTLGVTVAIAQGKVESGKVGSTIVGGVIIGILPVALGIWMFTRGLRRLPKPPPRASLPPGTPPGAPLPPGVPLPPRMVPPG